MDDLNLEGKYTHDRAYTQSKFAIVLFGTPPAGFTRLFKSSRAYSRDQTRTCLANEFTRRYGHLGVYANSVCPGCAHTLISVPRAPHSLPLSSLADVSLRR
jgi:hypothetical protein